MIDLGLMKLALIGTVALIVIGPKELPKVARMAGTLLGRAQRYISQVKSEVSREIELEELRKMQNEIQDAAQSFENSVHQEMKSVEQDFYTGMPEYDEQHQDKPLPSAQDFADKAQRFKRRKLARTSTLPQWYKNKQGVRNHVVSGAARMAQHRVKSKVKASFF
jgi:sec-independent protein translocase protein TatB